MPAPFKYQTPHLLRSQSDGRCKIRFVRPWQRLLRVRLHRCQPVPAVQQPRLLLCDGRACLLCTGLESLSFLLGHLGKSLSMQGDCGVCVRTVHFPAASAAASTRLFVTCDCKAERNRTRSSQLLRSAERTSLSLSQHETSSLCCSFTWLSFTLPGKSAKISGFVRAVRRGVASPQDSPLSALDWPRMWHSLEKVG